MVSLQTPVCEFDLPAVDFDLPGVDGKRWTLAECRGENGVLVMFICNHCPYVQAVRERIVRDTTELRSLGVNAVAIMSNDPALYEEDSFENMTRVARQCRFPFPYLLDESQAVARQYGAVCTPDFSATTPICVCSTAGDWMPAARPSRRRMRDASCLRRCGWSPGPERGRKSRSPVSVVR